MKVFVSDLHINDNTTYDDFSFRGRPFDSLFIKFMDSIEAKYTEAKKGNGSKRENKKLTLVLLGDIFDLFRTELYADAFGSDHFNPEVVSGVLLDSVLERNIAEKVIKDAFKSYKKSFDRLQTFASKSHTEIVYVIGNHDYPIMESTHLQKLFNDRLNTKIKFCHYLYENNIYAEHGNAYDLHNKRVLLDKSKKTRIVFGDAIVKYMINVFADKYHGVITKDLQRSGDIDNIRPVTVISSWIQSLSSSGRISKSIGRKMENDWAKLVDKLLETDFFKHWYRCMKGGKAGLFGNLLVGLAGKLKLSGRMLSFFSDVSQIKKDRSDHYRNVAENILKDRLGKIKDKPEWLGHVRGKAKKFVLFGHTHESKYEVFIDDKTKEKQFYINTGTWRKIIEPEISEGRWAKDFYARAEMGHTILYENNNKIQVELWDGTLL